MKKTLLYIKIVRYAGFQPSDRCHSCRAFYLSLLYIYSFYFLIFLSLFQDPAASWDVNDNDPDPFPRYDPTNENK